MHVEEHRAQPRILEQPQQLLGKRVAHRSAEPHELAFDVGDVDGDVLVELLIDLGDIGGGGFQRLASGVAEDSELLGMEVEAIGRAIGLDRLAAAAQDELEIGLLARRMIGADRRLPHRAEMRRRARRQEARRIGDVDARLLDPILEEQHGDRVSRRFEDAQNEEDRAVSLLRRPIEIQEIGRQGLEALGDERERKLRGAPFEGGGNRACRDVARSLPEELALDLDLFPGRDRLAFETHLEKALLERSHE